MKHYVWTASAETDVIVGSLFEFTKADEAFKAREKMVRFYLEDDDDEPAIQESVPCTVRYASADNVDRLFSERPGQFHDDTRVILEMS